MVALVRGCRRVPLPPARMMPFMAARITRGACAVSAAEMDTDPVALVVGTPGSESQRGRRSGTRALSFAIDCGRLDTPGG